MAPAVDNPCDAPGLVPPICIDGLAWGCPPGARVYERAPDGPLACRPFGELGGPLRGLGGSLPRVPTDDGRCLWIGDDVTLSTGEQLRNVAFEVPLGVPSGTCPARVDFLGDVAHDVVEVEGGDSSLVVQITGAFRFAGATRVTYRMFRADGGPQFGLTQLGSGLGRWDQARQRIVVPGPASLRFPPELDLGDASWVSGSRAYVWGCPAPIEFLTERCLLGRFDAAGTMELFAGGGRWLRDGTRRDAATVFDAGPWVSSVVALPGTARLAHVYAVGFGGDLQVHTAAAPEGPWTSGTSVARCDLPPGREGSFCAGPVVHLELADPTRPHELPVTYGLGTTAAGGSDAQAYWSRLQWVQVP